MEGGKKGELSTPVDGALPSARGGAAARALSLLPFTLFPGNIRGKGND